MKKRMLLLALSLAGFRTPILAQETPTGLTGTSSTAAQPGNNSAPCELHVWPTNKFVVTENLGGKNLGLVGAMMDEAMRLRSPEGIRMQMESQLSPAIQEKILNEVNLNTALSLSGYAVIIESADSQPEWNWVTLKQSNRMSGRAPACYAEFVIVSHQYMKQPIGTRLITLVRYREFGPDGALRKNLLDTTATKATQFPATDVNGIAASANSVQEAFRDNLVKFAKDKVKR